MQALQEEQDQKNNTFNVLSLQEMLSWLKRGFKLLFKNITKKVSNWSFLNPHNQSKNTLYCVLWQPCVLLGLVRASARNGSLFISRVLLHLIPGCLEAFDKQQQGDKTEFHLQLFKSLSFTV